MPAPRRSSECTVRSPPAARSAASLASCCPVLSVPWSRSTWRGPVPSTRQPIASPPGRASSPDAPPATSARTASRRSLPEDGPRQDVESRPGGRDLEPREARAGVGGQDGVARVGRTRGRSTIAATGTCPQPSSGRPTTRGLGHRRVPLEHGLDLRRVDVLAAAHDPVRPAVDDDEPAGRIEAAEIAGPDAARRRRPAARRGTRSSAMARRRRSRPRRPAPVRRCARSYRGAAGPPCRARSPPPRTAAP